MLEQKSKINLDYVYWNNNLKFPVIRVCASKNILMNWLYKSRNNETVMFLTQIRLITTVRYSNSLTGQNSSVPALRQSSRCVSGLQSAIAMIFGSFDQCHFISLQACFRCQSPGFIFFSKYFAISLTKSYYMAE